MSVRSGPAPLVCLLVLGSTLSANAQFSDVTASAGISFTHTGLGLLDKFQGTGAAWIDYDRDGDLDLYVTRRVGSNALFRNLGTGTFTEVTATAGDVADASHDGAGVAAADYDNDGYPDLYLANSDRDVLLRNLGNGLFRDVTSAAGLPMNEAARGTSVAWGDFDRDGWLDIYVANHEHLDKVDAQQRDRLYRNRGDGTFADVTDYLGLPVLDGYGFIGAWTDFDDDGDDDIFLVNDCPLGPEGIRILRNDGADGAAWRFTAVEDVLGATACDAGMGIAIGDYNRDGILDYFYTDIGNPVMLRGGGEGFASVAVAVGIDIPTVQHGYDRWTWGANFVDYDLDGWEDLYIASGAFRASSSVAPQPNVLFHNERDGTFRDVSAGSGCDDIDRSRTSIAGDYDGDGDTDLFVVNYEEPARLYRNDGEYGHHWVAIRLDGRESNRDGIGARVRIRQQDGAYQYREVRSGTSLGGGDEVLARFGLGSGEVVPEVLIRWPSGGVQVLTDVAADQLVTVVEACHEAPMLSWAQAGAVDGEIRVEWETGFENGLDYFEIRRTSDGVESWTVPARGPTLRPTRYEARYPVDGIGSQSLVLRLIGTDGRELSSSVVRTSPPIPMTVALTAPRPSPFASRTAFTLTVTGEQRVTVDVFDVRGRRVRTLHDATVGSGATVPLVLDGERLPSGVYMIRARGARDVREVRAVLVR